jgi:hypothetical protein
MIMNINEVHFSKIGTYRLFIQYYNVNAYITLHIISEEPTPSDETYINEENIIWSEYNFNDFTGLYLNVVWDRPNVEPLTLSLTNPNVIVTKKDGSERTARGTTKVDIITEDGGNLPKGTGYSPSDTVTRYYDLNSNGWRSFTNANLVRIDN